MGIRLHRILEAIDQGAATFEDIARLTGIGQGDCHGRRCGKKVAELLAASSRQNEEPERDNLAGS